MTVRTHSEDSEIQERNFRTERRLAMRVHSVAKKIEQHSTRIPVVCELRISTTEQCARCRSRRKTLVASLGWICTSCFDRCKEEAEKLSVERNAVQRIPEAYARAIRSYSEMSVQGGDDNQTRTRQRIKDAENSSLLEVRRLIARWMESFCQNAHPMNMGHRENEEVLDR
jgi:hypothetical protein